MRLSPFLLVATLILGLGYTYVTWNIVGSLATRLIIAIPFILIWLLPAFYWVKDRETKHIVDTWLHYAAYLSLGWLSFIFVLTLMRDATFWAMTWFDLQTPKGIEAMFGNFGVMVLSFFCVLWGVFSAAFGPKIREIDVPLTGLPKELDGFRVVQISDLHVGPTLGRRYVQRVVEKTRSLAPHLIALTGDLVDGRVADLKSGIAPLAELALDQRVFFIVGNHEYYSGVHEWIEYFRAAGVQVLMNSYDTVEFEGKHLLIAGVLDPAARSLARGEGPDPEKAIKNPEKVSPLNAADIAIKILLAHNPKIAPLAERAGFDLQLSGHTHAGQFFPWTFVTRLIHAPHYAGMSRQGRMLVYVNSGTGTWGPPIRFGTQAELTLLRLRCV